VRIALIDPGAYTPPYDDRLAAALAARGHEGHLLTAPFRFGETPEPLGYAREELFFRASSRVFRRSRARLPLKAVEYVLGMRRVLRRIDELEPDVVHVQWLFRRPDVDLRWLRRVERPTVFTAHDLAVALARRPEDWRRVYEAVDRVVVHSGRSVEQLAALGLARDRIVRIPHAAFDTAADGADPPRGATLLLFGLIRDYKGVDVALEALPAIADEVPDVRLVVAGDPVDPVEPLQGLAARLGIGDRIEWRLRFVEAAEARELMEAAALVMLPYRQRVDSSGVLASALGHARPVVVSDVGNLGETVEEFEAGAVVPPGDPRALGAACVHLLRDGRALQRAYEGALAARRALTWDASAEQHERLYNELVPPRRSVL
jgi:glycosyltransferase involved in cell wall biosynthesis